MEGAEDRQPTVRGGSRRYATYSHLHTTTLPDIRCVYLRVCVCGWGEGLSGNEFKEIIKVICARPTLVAPAVAAGVVAEVSCLLMHLPFLLLSANWSMYHIVLNTHCNTLQRTATECNRLQTTVVDLSTLQHTAPDLPALQHTAALDTLPRCLASQYTATRCNTLQHATTRCSKVHHTATHRNTLQHMTTLGTLPR